MASLTHGCLDSDMQFKDVIQKTTTAAPVPILYIHFHLFQEHTLLSSSYKLN